VTVLEVAIVAVVVVYAAIRFWHVIEKMSR